MTYDDEDDLFDEEFDFVDEEDEDEEDEDDAEDGAEDSDLETDDLETGKPEAGKPEAGKREAEATEEEAEEDKDKQEVAPARPPKKKPRTTNPRPVAASPRPRRRPLARVLRGMAPSRGLRRRKATASQQRHRCLPVHRLTIWFISTSSVISLEPLRESLPARRPRPLPQSTTAPQQPTAAWLFLQARMRKPRFLSRSLPKGLQADKIRIIGT